uniref:Gustatory receptor n=1 Tax=Panagrolaimus davidi TaxID=227884 RepID=A0A914QXJ4_9BILA
MEPFVQLIYQIFVSIAAATVILAPIGFFCNRIAFKIIHFNLRILTFVYGCLWCTFSVGCVLFYFVLDSNESPPKLYFIPQYQLAKLIAATSSHSFRMIETSIALERLLATVYFKNYETKLIFRIYPFIFIPFSFFIGFCFAFLFNVLQVPALVVYIFLVTVETTNFFLLYNLRKQNRVLRRWSHSKLLTSKYQIIENIRTLNLLIPQATISFVFSNTTIISTYILGIHYEPARTPLFLSLYCFNVIAISLYWIYQFQKQMSSKMSKFLRCISGIVRIQSTDSETAVKATTVQATLGLKIKMNQTVDEHFVHLKNTWL